MPAEKLENTTEKEVDNLISGGNITVDDEIRAFEGVNLSEISKSTSNQDDKKDDTKDTKDNRKDTVDIKDNKKVEKVTADIKTFDKAIGSNLASKEVKKPEEVKEVKEQSKEQSKEVDGKPLRDLEGFGEQEKIWLQRMPYESYEYFSKLLKDKKEIDKTYNDEKKSLTDKIAALESGKQILPESYYENPNAFVLSPEFGKLQHNAQLSKQVEDHWTEQLRKMEKGENWIPLTNDSKTGEIVYDEEREYSSDDKVYVLRQLTGASQQVAKFNFELERFVSGFNETHKTYVSKIKETEKTMLPVFENKETIEYKTYEAIKPKVEQWGIRKDNPAFDFLTKAIALNIIFRDALVSMLSEQQKTKSLKEEQVKAGPTASSFSGSGKNNNEVNKPTINDFNKVLHSGNVSLY